MNSLRYKTPAKLQPDTTAALPFGGDALELVIHEADVSHPTLLITAKSGDHSQAALQKKGAEQEESSLGDEKQEL